MKFEILSNSQNSKRKVVFFAQEHSFDMDIPLHTDFSLMLGCSYLGLDVSLLSSEVVNISGFCPAETWIKKTLTPPVSAIQGTIKIVTESDLCNGTGYYLFNDTCVYFDKNSKWCYIDSGNQLEPNYNVYFCENAIFSLCENTLIGIWIHLEE